MVSAVIRPATALAAVAALLVSSSPAEAQVRDTTQVDQSQGLGAGGVRNPAVYFGYDFNTPDHVVIGLKLETGRLSGLRGVAVVPELAFGFPETGTSVLVAGNFQYQARPWFLSDNFSIAPIIRAGVGVLSIPDRSAEGVINLGWGIASGFAQAADQRGVQWFIEHQGIDLFNRNRLAGGLRVVW